MTEKNQNLDKTDQKGMSRRNFFKLSALGATLGATALAGSKKEAVAASTVHAAVMEEHDSFPMKIASDYKRFSQKNVCFVRGMRAETPEIASYLEGYRKGEMALMGHGDRGELEKQPGWTAVDAALERAAWAVEDSFNFGSKFGVPQAGMNKWDGPTSSVQHRFADKKEGAKIIKRAAKSLGASLVGITPYDERWVYDPIFNALEGKEVPANFPFKPKSVVVMAIEMDYEQIATAPSWVGGAAIGMGYSQMAALGHSVATFIRSLGYKSFSAGNDIALSIPYAVAAGLGESGRNGMLVTYEYGPRVRLCKVFTELELVYDKPVTFGVRNFCEHCQRCADACPAKAIPKDVKPSFKTHNKSNNPGVEKWAVDGEKCLKYWGESRTDCATCLASCPYNKPDFWHHKLVVWATKAAPDALHSTMREMDILFGYGNTFDKKALVEWWDKA